MLHIQTPLYRYENLEKVYNSIPKHEDITWHVSKVKSRETPSSPIWEDKRVKLYNIDCKDSDTITKRNTSFAEMKDGWFHLLDDDTLFNMNMYNFYKSIKDDGTKMYVGFQNDKNGKTRLTPFFPVCGYIDSGNVLCHTSLLKDVKWHQFRNEPKDCVFWKKCYQVLGEKNLKFVKLVISDYNVLGL